MTKRENPSQRFTPTEFHRVVLYLFAFRETYAYADQEHIKANIEEEFTEVVLPISQRKLHELLDAAGVLRRKHNGSSGSNGPEEVEGTSEPQGGDLLDGLWALLENEAAKREALAPQRNLTDIFEEPRS
jgi:hypothetical protein